ncbi:hypothetical protein EGP98_03095 [bacterium]|nr:hypothetical protein [bacterium]
MKDEKIFKVLKKLKTNPLEFDEDNYDKETLGYLKKIIRSSDKLYGSKDSDYLRNKYAWYLEEYFYSNAEKDELKNINYLKKVAFGFFYQANPEDINTVFNNATKFIKDFFNQIDEYKETEGGNIESMETLLRDNGVATFSTILMYALADVKKIGILGGLLGINAYMVTQLKSKDSNKFNLEKTVKRFNELVSSLKMEDEPFTTALYGKRLADFCTGEMVFKTVYDNENDDRRIIKGKITTEELEEKAKQYIMRYRAIAQPINEVIDDIEILKASPKKEEDYSLYESVTALTATALDKISGENKITVENYLLKSLATSKKILEPKSRKSEFIAKVKKLYKK